MKKNCKLRVVEREWGILDSGKENTPNWSGAYSSDISIQTVCSPYPMNMDSIISQCIWAIYSGNIVWSSGTGTICRQVGKMEQYQKHASQISSDLNWIWLDGCWELRRSNLADNWCWSELWVFEHPNGWVWTVWTSNVDCRVHGG